MSDLAILPVVARLAAAVAAGYALPAIVAGAAIARAIRDGSVVANYRGVPVPLGLGAGWLAWGGAVFIIALGKGDPLLGIAPAALLVVASACLGWADDRFGDVSSRGFRGHAAALRQGRVTTGLVKATGISVASVAAAWFLPVTQNASGTARVAAWLSAAAVIALIANLVNLLDVRPARALKAYLLLALPAAASVAYAAAVSQSEGHGGWASVAGLLVLVTGPALAVWRMDVAERGMLGDMGANAAGALAGWLIARALPLPALPVVAVALLALNLASERVSFSAVIERNALLRWLDGLGRTERAAGRG